MLVAGLFAQGIPVQPQKFGGPDLIAPGCGESRRNQRIFDLPQDPVNDPGWRHLAALAEKLGEMPLRRVGKRRAPPGLPCPPVLRFDDHRIMRHDRRRIDAKFHVDQLRRDGFLRVERGEPAGEIFEFPDIAWPAIALEALEGIGFDTFERQAFGGGKYQEMLRKVADIFSAFAQRRQTNGRR